MFSFRDNLASLIEICKKNKHFLTLIYRFRPLATKIVTKNKHFLTLIYRFRPLATKIEIWSKNKNFLTLYSFRPLATKIITCKNKHFFNSIYRFRPLAMSCWRRSSASSMLRLAACKRRGGRSRHPRRESWERWTKSRGSSTRWRTRYRSVKWMIFCSKIPLFSYYF